MKRRIPIPNAVKELLQDKDRRKALSFRDSYDTPPNSVDMSNWFWARSVLLERQARIAARKSALTALTPIENAARERQRIKKESQILKLLAGTDVREVSLRDVPSCDRRTIAVHHTWIKAIFDKGLALIPVKTNSSNVENAITLSLTRPILGHQVDVWGAEVAFPHNNRWNKVYAKESGFIAKFNDHLAFGPTIRTVLQRLRAQFKSSPQLVYETARVCIK